MDYKGRLKEILGLLGKNGSGLSDDLGMSYNYFRKSTQNKGLVSSLWVRAFVIGYEMGLSRGCGCEKNGDDRKR